MFIFLGKISFRIAHLFPAGLRDALLRLSRFFGDRAIRASRHLRYSTADEVDFSYRLFSLICHRDVGAWLWTYASWRTATGKCPQVTLFDDGSLTAEDRALLEKLPALAVISRADADRHAEDYFRNFPGTLAYRRGEIMSRKFLDALAFSKPGETAVVFDADLLFFRRPDDLLRETANPAALVYVREGQPSYAGKPELLALQPDIPFGFNAGLCVWKPEWFQAGQIDQMLGKLMALPRLPMDYCDQVIYAMLAAGPGYRPLPESYTCEGTLHPVRDRLVMKHYHSCYREFMALEGLWILLIR